MKRDVIDGQFVGGPVFDRDQVRRLVWRARDQVERLQHAISMGRVREVRRLLDEVDRTMGELGPLLPPQESESK